MQRQTRGHKRARTHARKRRPKDTHKSARGARRVSAGWWWWWWWGGETNESGIKKKLSISARVSLVVGSCCAERSLTLVQSDSQSYDPQGWHGSAERIQIPPLVSAPPTRHHQFLLTG